MPVEENNFVEEKVNFAGLAELAEERIVDSFVEKLVVAVIVERIDWVLLFVVEPLVEFSDVFLLEDAL